MKELTVTQTMILEYCINNPKSTPEEIKEFIKTLCDSKADYVSDTIYTSFLKKMSNYSYTYDELMLALNENFKNFNEVQMFLWNIIYTCSTRRTRYLYTEEDFLIVSINADLIKSIIVQTTKKTKYNGEYTK